MPRIRRRSCCAQIAPYWPVVAPATATVLSRSAAAAMSGARPSRSRSSALRAPSRCTPASTRGARPPPRCRRGARATDPVPRRPPVEILRRSAGGRRARRRPRPRRPAGASSAAARASAVLYELCPQAAGDGEDPHRQRLLHRRERRLQRRPRSARRKPPPGSGAFQFSPKSVRSTVVCELEPDALVAYGSRSCSERARPCSSTGLVTPLIVSVALDDELLALAPRPRSTRSRSSG